MRTGKSVVDGSIPSQEYSLVSSEVEHCPDKTGVEGSLPSVPTMGLKVMVRLRLRNYTVFSDLLFLPFYLSFNGLIL